MSFNSLFEMPRDFTPREWEWYVVEVVEFQFSV